MKNNKELFEKDLKEVYKLSTERGEIINSYLRAIDENCNERKRIDGMLKFLKIPISKESRFAIVSRITNLRESGLIEHMKSLNFSDKKIIEVREYAHEYAKSIHMASFNWFIEEIERRDLLTPFYRTIIYGVHKIGISMNAFHIRWNSHIINKVNPELERRFKSQKSIMKYLREKNLLDNGHDGIEADRCYSALVKDRGRYTSKSYCEVFSIECNSIISGIKRLMIQIGDMKDDVYNQKEEWMNYFNSLIFAFGEKNVDHLVFMWANVDRAWMKLTSPIQVVHPMEYYEDHYRKAVAVEWDLRIQNLDIKENKRHELTIDMFEKKILKYGKEKYLDVYKNSMNNLENTQLYLSEPVLYYGSFFDGLFSAQIVPNDTVVSSELGKKIFAFPDRILKSEKDNPFTKFPSAIFEKEFLDEYRKFIYNNSEDFHRIYDINTIGHEYGHALWLDKESEIIMNKTGNFKNIEEFKATTGGMMTFFNSEEEDLKRVWLRELVFRSVGLMVRREIPDLRPYYCEGLIHLTGLIEIGVIKFDGKKIKVNLNNKKYEEIKSWYLEIYDKLALHYLEKRDALEFLNKYEKEDEKTFSPTNSKANELALWIYDKYQEFGNVLDESVKKEDYINN